MLCLIYPIFRYTYHPRISTGRTQTDFDSEFPNTYKISDQNFDSHRQSRKCIQGSNEDWLISLCPPSCFFDVLVPPPLIKITHDRTIPLTVGWYRGRLSGLWLLPTMMLLLVTGNYYTLTISVKFSTWNTHIHLYKTNVLMSLLGIPLPYWILLNRITNLDCSFASPCD